MQCGFESKLIIIGIITGEYTSIQFLSLITAILSHKTDVFITAIHTKEIGIIHKRCAIQIHIYAIPTLCTQINNAMAMLI